MRTTGGLVQLRWEAGEAASWGKAGKRGDRMQEREGLRPQGERTELLGSCSGKVPPPGSFGGVQDRPPSSSVFLST